MADGLSRTNTSVSMALHKTSIYTVRAWISNNTNTNRKAPSAMERAFSFSFFWPCFCQKA